MKQKAELTKGLSFGSSAIFDLIRPAAFRALLTKGLALSGESHLLRDTVLLSKGGDYVNKKREIVKIYLFLCQLE
jgi:hypothetical protein